LQRDVGDDVAIAIHRRPVRRQGSPPSLAGWTFRDAANRLGRKALPGLEPMSKPKLKWSSKDDGPDFDAALKYLSLLASDARAEALVSSLRSARPVEHAAKDLLRAAQLPLLPRDEPHVDADLKRIEKGKPLPSVLLVRGEMAGGLPLVIADGYHRICAVLHFDESAPIPCRIVGLGE
jgi:hypothetical protein